MHYYYQKKGVEERSSLSHKYSYFKRGLYNSHRLQEAVIEILKNIPLKELENFENILDLGCGGGNG